MMLGRLSVNTAVEANTMVNKIMAYEQTPVTGDWRQQVLAVADNADEAGYYNIISDDLLNCCMPASYTATKVYYGVTHTDVDSARAAILAGYGKFIVNYIGHGYTIGWATESLFTTSSVPNLTNGDKQPIVLAMACLEGYFINPNSSQEALAEVTTRAEGKGAIASWSGTGQGDAGGQDYLDRGFLNAVFRDSAETVGAATLASKLNLWTVGASPYLLDTFLLFGDPGLRFEGPIPTAVELLNFTAKYEKKSVVLNWETASEMDNVGFNIYRARTIDGVKKKINTDLIQAANPGSPEGAVYSFTNTKVKQDKKYFYWLESVDINGNTSLHGPIKVKTKVN